MKNYKKQTYMMRKLVFFLLLVIAVLPMQAKEDVTLTAEARGCYVDCRST